MELVVARRGHTSRRRHGYSLCPDMPQGGQRLGIARRRALPRGHAVLVCGIDGLPCPAPQKQVERKVEEMGPRRHLLAHSGQLLPSHAHSTAQRGVLGLGIVLLYMVLRLGRDGYKFHKT